jgi:glycopeptide antibiotics resistance protein
MLNSITADKTLNLVPLITLKVEDITTSLLNILMMIPFGFGLPFISNFRLKKITLLGFIFSFVIELSQLVTGYIAKMTFRIADVNDLIFNTTGVMIGYILFILFLQLSRSIYLNKRGSSQSGHLQQLIGKSLGQYIANRPQR